MMPESLLCKLLFSESNHFSLYSLTSYTHWMISLRLMSLFFHRDSLLRIFMWLMGFGILILLDNLATIWIASVIGAYTAVALVGVVTWVCLAIVFSAIARHIRIARVNAAKGTYSKMEYVHLSGLMLSAILIISPGFMTDILAWLIFVTPVRLSIGALVYYRFKSEFEQIHQHLATEEP